ncbi:ABC transporter substrate-binding protein [Halorussus amylolyticus]|uniref:ABC transporter substrate-binding protein n=1 Tax=Halorussus amylolyticus TaxID=1126242 RepID=UPI001049F016|nr:ABC transporter substrate-binding protein [Halorussus amylolyticus]
MSSDPKSESRFTRRELLAGGSAVAAASTAGCIKRVRSVFGRTSPRQVSIQVKTVPADSDEYSVRIAREFAKQCREAGIDATVVPMALEELQRQVLLNREFDVYVGQFPEASHIDPDVLYPLLHSAFSGESGWQNPFGFADLELDERLEAQRTAESSERAEAVDDAQTIVAREQPFVPVVAPDVIQAIRRGRFTGWTDYGPNTPLGYLAARTDDDTDEPQPDDEFRGVLTDQRVTENLNPLAVEFRRHGTFTDLLYDPLARRFDGETRPWLASDWEWETDGGRAARVTLRDDLAWHDGEPLTADDVAFTYRFLVDTSLREAESPVPASRYRGRSSLVTDVESVDDRTVRLEFEDAGEAVAERALTLPILPEEVWSDQTELTSIAGIDLQDDVTEALVWNNPDPVGSGPFEFVRRSPREMLLLERYDDHFLWRDDDIDAVERFGDASIDRLSVRVTSSDVSAVELVASGEADATITGLSAKTVPRIARSDELELSAKPTRAFYHIGFNTRRAPMANPRFRRALARLVDKSFVANEVFDGYARPIASPLAGTRWLADDLRFDENDPVVPFVGSDGELDRERAQSEFQSAGFRYENGLLVGR